jgi:hypothetical protein
VWQTASGLTPKPELLVKAAQQASERFFDYALAQRLAAAAYEAGGGLRAGLVRAKAQHMQGRAAEAEQLLAEFEPQAVTSEERAHVTFLRVDTLLQGFGRSQRRSRSYRRQRQPWSSPAGGMSSHCCG